MEFSKVKCKRYCRVIRLMANLITYSIKALIVSVISSFIRM